jgi:endonuclease YncB( thermonuclease family)
MVPSLLIAALSVIGLFGSPFEMPPSAVTLDGEHVSVGWNDADSFEILEGAHKDGKVRLMGYNALESYGPVHSWGTWEPIELYQLTKKATDFVRSKEWTCTWSKQKDHYGRLLIECPDLTKAMLGEGLGHLLVIDAQVDPALLAIQQKAIAEKKGMWAKGVPEAIITSVHSADEGGKDKEDPYIRLADPHTGLSHKKPHHNTYKTCEKVCDSGSCLIYVPFTQRYGDKAADCLKTKGKL